MSVSTRRGKRPVQDDSAYHTFSCSSCYSRKVKCDKANPCSHCSLHQIECLPSPIATTNRPRKRRFPEAELLSRIKKYEAALLSYGADLEVIRGRPISRASASTSKSVECETSLQCTSPDSTHHPSEYRVLSILDGEPSHESKSDSAGQKWYDRIFSHVDPSSFLFAVEPIEVCPHPAPFDMFTLWQIYCDNVQPLNKTLHAPTFQRKISTYGAHLHLAPPSDQSLFFAVYVAALTTLSPGECEAILFTNKDDLLNQYKLATQVWLRRAGLWRTSELSVLQAFVLFLSSIQNVVEPRSISCFTVVADRIARRMGLHRDSLSRRIGPLEQEIRKRVWWELQFLDARALERVGSGTSLMASSWSVSIPSNRSDADLESLQRTIPSPSLQPSSEMVFFLIRAEVAQFLANLRNQRNNQGQGSELSNNVGFRKKLRMVGDLEKRLQSQYLCFCDSALPHHRLTTMFAQMMISKMHISIYSVEESMCRDESRRLSVGLEFLQQCTSNLQACCDMREDDSLDCFNWFIMQNLPILGYIHLLRLLQVHVTGSAVDEAWKAVQRFKNTGIRLVIDSLTMKAWKAREAASPNIHIEEPAFITELKQRHLAAATTDMLPHLSSNTSNSPSDSDFMAMLNEMMSGEAFNEFDWSLWTGS